MRKNLKKVIATLFCLIFLISISTSANSVSIQRAINEKEENIVEEDIFTDIITLMRFGPDGSETPIEVEIEIKEGQDYYDAVLEKCNEILENDEEITSYFNSVDENNSNSSFKLGYKAKVLSYGRGFHFKMKWKLTFFLMNRIFSIFLPKIRMRLNRPLIFCNYGNDTGAKTIIGPNKLVNQTQSINGSHSILLKNFVGIALWSGHFQRTSSIPRLILGKANVVVTYQRQNQL